MFRLTETACGILAFADLSFEVSRWSELLCEDIHCCCGKLEELVHIFSGFKLHYLANYLALSVAAVCVLSDFWSFEVQ